MTQRPRRPAPLHASALNAVAAQNPADRLEAAHSSAYTVISRLRDGSDPDAGARMAAAVDSEEGLDAAARLWSVASPVSLPGALWRLLALRAGVRRAPSRAAAEFEAGRLRLPVAEVVAGVAEPPGPDEVSAMVDAVLHGVGVGDLGVAFERAAAFARVCSVGRAVLADEPVPMTEVAGGADDGDVQARRLTQSASALAQTADALEAAARRWRRHELD